MITNLNIHMQLLDIRVQAESYTSKSKPDIIMKGKINELNLLTDRRERTK